MLFISKLWQSWSQADSQVKYQAIAQIHSLNTHLKMIRKCMQIALFSILSVYSANKFNYLSKCYFIIPFNC